jgi:hypothetical protein
VLPFLTDYRSREWASFDTEPAHAAIVAIAPTAQPSGDGSTIYIPSIPGDGGSADKPPPSAPPVEAAQGRGRVIAENGLNVRAEPGTQYEVLHTLPYGTLVEFDGVAGEWLRLADGAGWVHGSYVGSDAPVAPSNCWQRAVDFTLRIEGGLSTDRDDPGNYRPDGTFGGTKYGISARSYPDLDIPNLTKEQAIEIYRRDYWTPSGAERLECPLAMAVFDQAVNGGVDSARQLLAESGENYRRFMAERIRWYTKLSAFERYGRAWMRRIADLLRETA